MARHLALAACAVVLALAPARSNADQIYKVKKGDTLHQIARVFRVGVDDLKQANGLESNNIRPGAKLKVPKSASKSSSESAKRSAAKESSAEPSAAPEADAAQDEGAGADSSAAFHVVKKGETLHAISRAYDVSVEDLRRLNGIGKAGKIKVGAKLSLKPGAPKAEKKGTKAAKAESQTSTIRDTYVVKKGDSVFRIAQKFSLSGAELKRLNGLRSDALKPGQKLVVGERQVARREKEREEEPEELGTREEELSTDLEALAVSPEGEEPRGGITGRVVRVAKRMLHIPYRFGGNTLRGIDCSAYVQKVFRFLNVPLPRTAREQYAVGKPVDRNELETGDLVFFRTYARFPSHVGIYLGDNKFIHASSINKKVTIDSLDTPFYEKRFIGAKRLVEEEVGEQKDQAAKGESAG